MIAMGRLGGGELGYGSDADVLFVCEPLDGASEHEAAKFAHDRGRDRPPPARQREPGPGRW